MYKYLKTNSFIITENKEDLKKPPVTLKHKNTSNIFSI